jgi:hypothetical protein
VKYRCDKYGDIDYLDITELFVWSDRLKKMVPASPRFIFEFYGDKILWLEGQVREHSAEMAEYYMQQLRDNLDTMGDTLMHDRQYQ